MPKYRIHMRNGQTFTIHADSEDEAWKIARARVAEAIKKHGGTLRGSRPTDHIASMESDI